MQRVTDFELIDHGIDNPQYFSGCGVTFTEFARVVTGCGDNPQEAIDDALEQLAMDDVDSDDLQARIIAAEKDNPALVTHADGSRHFPDTPSAFAELMSANGFGDDDAPDDDDERDTWEQDRESFIDGADSNYYYISIRYTLPTD